MTVKSSENIAFSAGMLAEERERIRIAKDLHDSIGQQLTAIKLYLNTAQSISNGSGNQKFDSIVSKSINALDEAIVDLSNICFNLMPSALHAYGLHYVIKELARKLKVNKKIDVAVKISSRFPRLEQCLEISLFRTVQEFINNAMKHGAASKITINAEPVNKGKEIKIVLKDNGRGFKIDKSATAKGTGLNSTKSRIEYHSGKINITSKIGKGTQFEITLPINKQTV